MPEPLPDGLLPHEQQIQKLSERLDRDAITPVAEWLQNFERDEVGSILPLLERFRFIDKSKIGGWCQKLHFSALRGRESAKVAVIGLGPGGKSGTHLLDPYGKANYLAANQLYSQDGLGSCLSKQFRDLVILDDVIGSGNQASEYLSEIKNQLPPEVGELTITFVAMIGMEDSVKRIEKEHSIQVVVKETRRETDKPFRSRYVFRSDQEADRAMQICKRYGEYLFPEHPLGYGDCQMLIAFDHNTPNNTLPIFWSEVGGWLPLFPRTTNRPDLVHEFSSGSSSADAPFLSNISSIIAGAVRHSLKCSGPIIWIDDNPQNNQLESATMRALGVDIVQGTTTAEGINLAGKFSPPAVIITDMARQENGHTDSSAGLKFIQELREKGFTNPVLIYSENFSPVAKFVLAGVTVIKSPEHLIIEVAKNLGSG